MTFEHGELGEEIVKFPGSPKAMQQINAYLYNVRPTRVELVVDEKYGKYGMDVL